MKILVNALPFRYGGGVSYLQQQLDALARVTPTFDLHTLLSPWTDLRGLPGTTERVPVRSVPARFAYEQFSLGFRRADVLYCPANFGPVVHRTPVVLTIHNAHYYRAGLALPDTKTLRPAWKVRANHLAMKQADAIVAISYAQAEEAIATVSGIEDKVHVIHSGVAQWPSASTPVDGLPDRYILSVANAASHKRTVDVVNAWSRAKAEVADGPSLVLVGGATEKQRIRYRTLARRNDKDLLMLGQVRERAKLKWLYEHASALVSMSVLESFPLTPGEAGSVGCPLILSDIPAHREVTLGNASYVPPRDVKRLAEVLVDEGFGWDPASRHWRWPVTWEDGARRLSDLIVGLAE